jgi:hypothetical protein
LPPLVTGTAPRVHQSVADRRVVTELFLAANHLLTHPAT